MFLYFYISIDTRALVRTTGAKDPSACLASLTLGNYSYAFMFYYAIILIILSLFLLGLLDTQHCWQQAVIFRKPKQNSPTVGCNWKYIFRYRYNLHVWPALRSSTMHIPNTNTSTSSIRGFGLVMTLPQSECVVSQTKIWFFSSVSGGLKYLVVPVKEEKGEEYILSKFCLHLACLKTR